MKTKLRRITAMALVFSLVTSMVGIVPAFAVDGSSKDQIATAPNSSDYAYYTQDGTDDTNAGLDPLSQSYNKATANSDGTGATAEVYKEITALTENNFQINLKVVTTDVLSKIPSSVNAAVVLVMDSSGSMTYDVDGNSPTTYEEGRNGRWVEVDNPLFDGTSRMSLAKPAAKAFVDSFIEGADEGEPKGKRYVSVVDFDTDAAVVTTQNAHGWIDAAASEANLTAVKDAIDGMEAAGGTNIYDGLSKADAQLDKKIVSDITNLYVVLLTDGAPTYGSDANTNNQKNSGSRTDTIDLTSAEKAAQGIIGSNAILYGIAFASGGLLLDNNDATYKNMSIGTWLSTKVVTPGCYINATTGGTLNLGFSNIATRIAQLSKAWEVTDPMGKNIVLDESSISGTDSATVENGTITWKLRDDVPASNADNTVFTYEMSYNISLDTSADTFDETDKDGNPMYYLTNGKTVLNYCFTETVIDDNGNYTFPSDMDESILTPLDFKVPAVKGTFPVYGYTVKHWTQVTDADRFDDAGVELVNGKYYEEVTGDRVVNTDTKKNTPVTVYANDYTANYFTCISGASQSATITGPDRVFNFYYTKDTTNACEYHIYETVTYTDAKPEGNTTSYTDDYPSGTIYIGTNYVANEVPVTNYDLYKIVVISDGKTQTYTNKTSVDLDVIAQEYVEDKAQNNQFYFYYTRDDEQREVSVTVNHLYTEYGWVLNAAKKYVPGVVAEFEGTPDESGKMTYGTPYPVLTDDTYDGGIKPGFSLISADSGKLGAFTPTSDGMEIDLHYEKPADRDDLKAADITVYHIYEVETTKIVDGVKTTLDPVEEDRDIITVTGAYVGEDFTANLKPSSDDNTNTYPKQNYKDAELTIEKIGEGSHEIFIHYLREDNQTVTTSVTVEHKYLLHKGEIVTDESSENFGSYVIVDYPQDDMTWSETISTRTVDGVTSPLYQLQSFTATEGGAPADATEDERAVYAEYTKYDASPEDMTITLGAAADNKITIFYDDTQELDEAAEVKVVHRYRTVTDYYDGGSLQHSYTDYVTDHTYDDSYTTGHLGERYTVTDFHYSSNGMDGYSLADNKTEADFYVTLTGNTQTITIDYERTVRDYSSTEVVVNHHFVTRESYVDGSGNLVELKPVDPEDHVILGTPTGVNSLGEPLYTGMSYSAASQIDNTLFGDGAYTAAEGNVSSISRLAASGNQIDLYYYLDDTSALADVNLQVIHVYETYKFELQGTNYVRVYSEDSRTGDQAEDTITGYYAGQYYTLATLAEGEYTLNNDPTKTDSDYSNRLLVKSTDPEATVDNVIYIYYEKMAENEEVPHTATLNVKHVYTTQYMSGKPSTTVSGPDDSFLYCSFKGVNYPVSTITKGGKFTLQNYDTEHTVTEVTPNTAYTVLLDSVTNEITFNYLRILDDRIPMTVAVYHNYFCYDPAGIPAPEGSGTVEHPTVYLHEGSYTPDGEFFYAPVPEAGQYEYSFSDGTLVITDGEPADYTLGTSVELGEGNSYVFNLNYCREVEAKEEGGGGGSTTTYYTLTATYVDEDGNPIASTVTSRVKSGRTYSTELKSIDGYSFVTTEGDATTGIMNNNKSVVYIYTVATEDVPEEDIPLTDIPDTETPPPVDVPDEDIPLVDVSTEEVPLTDVPQTGDNRNILPIISTALLSAAGLAFLAKQELDEKKKKSEN